MTDLISGIFGLFAVVASTLGLKGMFMAGFGLVLVTLLLRVGEKADRMFERLQRRWRRLHPPTRYAILFCVAVAVGPAVYDAFPKTTGFVIVVCCLYLAYWMQGAQFMNRYGLEDATARTAWLHHLEVRRLARRGAAAVGDATGKKGAKVTGAQPRPTGVTMTVQPPFGQSGDELADDINNGRVSSAVKAHTGRDVRSMSGTVTPDGVIVEADLVDPYGADTLADTHWWDDK